MSAIARGSRPGESGRIMPRILTDAPSSVARHALLHDAVDRGQPQSGSLPGRLGREERLEDVRAGLLVHAGSGIADREHHVRTGPGVGMAMGVIDVEVDVAGF